MKKNYYKSKVSLEGFIENFPDNQLSGSAHFWLGKIYLFESNYRKAAIVFGEGVQRFPQSIKAAEMYYELSKSLKEYIQNEYYIIAHEMTSVELNKFFNDRDLTDLLERIDSVKFANKNYSSTERKKDLALAKKFVRKLL